MLSEEELERRMNLAVARMDCEYPAVLAFYFCNNQILNGDRAFGLIMFDTKKLQMDGVGRYSQMKEHALTIEAKHPHVKLVPFDTVVVENEEDLKKQFKSFKRRYLAETYQVILPTSEEIDAVTNQLKERSRVAIMLNYTPDKHTICLSCHFLERKIPLKELWTSDLRKGYEIVRRKEDQRPDDRDIYFPLYVSDFITPWDLNHKIREYVEEWLIPLKRVLGKMDKEE